MIQDETQIDAFSNKIYCTRERLIHALHSNLNESYCNFIPSVSSNGSGLVPPIDSERLISSSIPMEGIEY